MPNFNGSEIPAEMRETTQDIAEGTTRAFIKLGIEEIKKLAQRFLNKELVFIEDEETINLVKRQFESGEWAFFSNYVKDKQLKLLVGMGLALRELEMSDKRDKLENLRDKLYFKYKEKGLHIAQFVQCKLLVAYISRLIDKCSSSQEVIEKIEDLLKDLERRVSFIQSTDSADSKYSLILLRLDSNSPTDYLVFVRDSALPIGKSIRKKLNASIEEHGYEMKAEESKTSLILILSKKRAQI